MASKRRIRILDYGVYLIVRGAQCFVQCMSLPMAQRLGRWVGRIGGILIPPLARRVRHNLAIAFPDAADAELNRLRRRVHEHIGMLIAEILWLPRIARTADWRRYVSVDGAERIDAARAEGKGIIFVTGHIGNWETGGVLGALLGYPLHVVARPIDNPYLDQLMTEVREATRQRVLSKFGALKEIFRVLRDNGMVALVADQNAGKDGVFVDFFGRKASTISSVAAIAIKTGKPILGVVTQRIPGMGSFHVTVGPRIQYDPARYASKEEAIHDITQQYTSWFETCIRKYPEQWLWTHRRWKTQPPPAAAAKTATEGASGYGLEETAGLG